MEAAAEEELALALKDRGNACFAKGRHEEALEAYAAALRAIGKGDGGKEEKEEEDKQQGLRCTLHSNRAACHLQLQRFADCVEEATAALALNPQTIKALYRRAQACERLGQLEPALRDLRQALQLDPGNRDVLGAARRVGEALQAQLQRRSPVAQMLDLVRSPPRAGDVEEERRRRREALMGLVGLASQEPQAAYDVLREADVLVALLEREGEGAAEERLLGFRLLAACCAHPDFVQRAFGGGSPEAAAGDMLVRVLEAESEESDAVELALVKITLFLRLRKALGPAALEEGSTAAALTAQALECWTGALLSAQPSVQEAGLDALLWWCDCAGGDTSLFFSDEEPRARGLDSLLALLTAEHDEGGPSSVALRIKAAHALGRLLSVDKGQDGAQAVVAQALAGAAGKGATEGSLLVLLAAFLADPALGAKAVVEDQTGAAGCLQAALAVGPSSSSTTAQVLAAELLNVAASSEEGRACLGPVLGDAPAALQALMASSAPGARVAAASAFTKLGLAAKALSSSSSELPGLLGIAATELQRAAEAKPPTADALGASSSSSSSSSVDRAMEVLCCLVTRTAFKDELAYGSGRCRACLPLFVKLALDAAGGPGSGSGSGSGESATKTTATYGLAFLLASLCLSNDELRKEALRERDVSPEEYEQLQRIQQLQQPGPHGGPPGAAAVDEADPPERVAGRIKELVRLGGVRALARLAGLPNVGPRTQEQVAMALAQVAATLPECRGLMVQQGAYNACLDLGKKEKEKDGTAGGVVVPEGTRARALHALAKILVTTNPAVLSDRQRASAVPNLLWLCRWPRASNLQQFEALMALTNLAAADEACLEAVAAHKGVPCFQSLQYSDHPMVRRAATEAMCNLACHPAALKHLSDPEKLKIWLALAGAYEGEEEEAEDGGDLPTARAAAGALAMASGNEGVAQALAVAGAGRVLAALLRSGNPELVHRAAIVVRNMARFPEPRSRLQEDGALGQALAQLLRAGATAAPLPPATLSAMEEAQKGLGEGGGGGKR